MPKPNRKRLDDNEYIVEEIIGKRRKGKEIEYLVKWEGYSEEECTWEHVDNLYNVWDMIEEYESNTTDTKKPHITEKSSKIVSIPQKAKLVKDLVPVKGIEKEDYDEDSGILNAKSKSPLAKKLENSRKIEDYEPKLIVSFDEDEETDEVPEFGDFRFGDHPKRIVSCKPKNGEIMLTIEWYPRPNGTFPMNTVILSSLLKKHDPALLIEYYENKLQFGSKEKEQSKADNSLNLEKVNGKGKTDPFSIERENRGKAFQVHVNGDDKQRVEMSSSSKKQTQPQELPIKSKSAFKFSSLAEDKESSRESKKLRSQPNVSAD